MKISISNNETVPVIVAGNNNINNLGVVRTLGRHGVPTILLSANRRDIVRYSRYIGQKLPCPDPQESEKQFIDFLIELGDRTDGKQVIIPTNDATVMAISRFKDMLEQYYVLPFPGFDIVEQLVDKRKFYRLLDRIAIPHPVTLFPDDISQLKSIGESFGYPFIIKPAYMHLFIAEFHTKCFVVNSSEELDDTIQRLNHKDLDIMIQEIIPGKELYSFSTYLNKKSQPLAVCGYDKLRQNPPDFGIGTLWRSAWKEEPIDLAVKTLQAINYYGIAEPEFKKDPRDGQYKFLEINARTIIPNALPVKCGTDIIYTAYLDTLGKYHNETIHPREGILWVSEVGDLRSCLRQLFSRKLGIREIVKSLRGKKVYATASRDDFLPFIVSLLNYTGYYLRRVFGIRSHDEHS